MAALTTPQAVFSVGGRALFALVVGYLALGNLLDLDTSVGYARHKGVPLARVAVPAGSLVLVVGALAVALGVYPALGAVAVLAVLTPITVTMHDFWALEGEKRRNERIHFLKNVGLLGTALLVLALTAAAWPYGLGIGL